MNKRFICIIVINSRDGFTYSHVVKSDKIHDDTTVTQAIQPYLENDQEIISISYRNITNISDLDHLINIHKES